MITHSIAATNIEVLSKEILNNITVEKSLKEEENIVPDSENTSDNKEEEYSVNTWGIDTTDAAPNIEFCSTNSDFIEYQ